MHHYINVNSADHRPDADRNPKGTGALSGLVSQPVSTHRICRRWEIVMRHCNNANPADHRVDADRNPKDAGALSGLVSQPYRTLRIYPGRYREAS